MATRQHHYVPRFYLSRFASKPKRINLYNLQRNLAKEDVSLKDQCKKPNFYGDADIERALSALEDKAAKCIEQLINNPPTNPPETLLEFVAVQYLRTPTFAKIMDAATKKHFSLIASGMPLDERTELLSHLMGPQEMTIFNLTMKDHVVEDIKDMKLVVVNYCEDVFITSDNPLYFYNQYCQKTQRLGKTGSRTIGLQIFLPLSPRDYLILYDGKTYDYVKKQAITIADIRALNAFQVISAEANLYFSDWARSEEIGMIASQTAQLRMSDAAVAEEFENDEDPYDTLLHTYVDIPNSELDLTFLRVKKRALRVPMSKRWGRRKGNSRPSYSDKPPVGSRTYSKMIAKV